MEDLLEYALKQDDVRLVHGNKCLVRDSARDGYIVYTRKRYARRPQEYYTDFLENALRELLKED